MPIHFKCPQCGHKLTAAIDLANKDTQCTNCGRFVKVPDAPPPPSEPTKASPAGTHVVTNHFNMDGCVITDIRIPFWRCVCIIIKWSLAAIPAMIILGILYVIFSLFVLGGLGAALSRSY